MSKFKIGCKVRVVEEYTPSLRGRVGTVTGHEVINFKGSKEFSVKTTIVEFDKKGESWRIGNAALELADDMRLKKGDLVRFIKNRYPNRDYTFPQVGEVGTVLNKCNSSGGRTRVKFIKTDKIFCLDTDELKWISSKEAFGIRLSNLAEALTEETLKLSVHKKMPKVNTEISQQSKPKVEMLLDGTFVTIDKTVLYIHDDFQDIQGYSRCHPDDKFSKEVGMALAYYRAFNKGDE